MSDQTEKLEANPEDLKEFLRSEAPPGSVQFEADEDVKSVLQTNQEEETSVETKNKVTRTEIPMDMRYGSQHLNEQKILHWTLEMPDIGEIVVSDKEKTAYIKSVLNDEPVILTIHVPFGNDGLDVEIKTRSVFEERAIFNALDIATYERQEFKDPAAFVTRSQHLSSCVQILSVNGKAMPSLDLRAAGENVKQAGSMIEKHANEILQNMSGPRWSLIVTALRIFEAKIHLCNNNINNATFWKPAS